MRKWKWLTGGVSLISWLWDQRGAKVFLIIYKIRDIKAVNTRLRPNLDKHKSRPVTIVTTLTYRLIYNSWNYIFWGSIFIVGSFFFTIVGRFLPYLSNNTKF
ncbi:hypothetical protein NL108_004207 [Boleophthalmus pectinirostris]|nr:hypothetical protein NL108_004207 [Boleophthalmus pectinirostris]